MYSFVTEVVFDAVAEVLIVAENQRIEEIALPLS